MNRNELFKRTRATLRPEIAAQQVFAFIGAGSGGARAAEEAARAGIGTILLIDRPGECLEEHNIIRHPLGYRDLGRLKIEAMADRLRDINPECQVIPISLDVRSGSAELAEILRREKVGKIFLGTDNEPSKHAVNRVAVELGIVMVFAGVFDGGCGGEVGICRPGQACYACFASFLKRACRYEEPKQDGPIDYSSSPEQPGSAALNIDIAQIALIQARVGLSDIIATQDPAWAIDGNYVLFGNRPVPDLFPRALHSEIWSVPRDSTCTVCNLDAIAPGDSADRAAAIMASLVQVSGRAPVPAAKEVSS